MFSQIVELLYFLPCRYNYQHKFCFDGYSERFCDSAEEQGAFLIHGSANTFYNSYAPAFRIINEVFIKVSFLSFFLFFFLCLFSRPSKVSQATKYIFSPLACPTKCFFLNWFVSKKGFLCGAFLALF